MSRFYTGSLQVDHRTGGLQFRPPDKTVDVLTYFGLYKYFFRMGTDPVLTASAVQCCLEVDWKRTATKDGYKSYHFSSAR